MECFNYTTIQKLNSFFYIKILQRTRRCQCPLVFLLQLRQKNFYHDVYQIIGFNWV